MGILACVMELGVGLWFAYKGWKDWQQQPLSRGGKMINKEYEKHICKECDFYEIKDDDGWCYFDCSPVDPYEMACIKWEPDKGDAKWLNVNER